MKTALHASARLAIDASSRRGSAAMIAARFTGVYRACILLSLQAHDYESGVDAKAPRNERASQQTIQARPWNKGLRPRLMT
jgi:hypothetical protein